MNWILIQHQEWNSTCRNRLILTRCVYSEISQEDSGKEGLEQARSLGFLNAAVWLPLPVQQEPESPGFQDNDVNILDEAIPKTQRQWICKRINNKPTHWYCTTFQGLKPHSSLFTKKSRYQLMTLEGKIQIY